MKQVLQSYRTGELKVVDVPAPRVGHNTVLIRTGASLISAGTERQVMDLAKKSLAGKAMERPDLVNKVAQKLVKDGVIATIKAVTSTLDQPIPLGYSACGVVIDRGPGAEAFSLGDRVACAGAKFANHAEFNSVPINLVVGVPDRLSSEEAAFATVGAIAMQGVRTARLTLGESVGVIGMGLIGQLTAQLCRAQGCRVLGIEPDPSKLELATTLGANLVVKPGPEVADAVSKISDGRGLDAVIICAAGNTNEPVELAGEISRDRGRVVVVGSVQMNIPRRPYYDKEIGVFQSRSYGPGRYDPNYEEKGIDYPYGYVRWTEGRNIQAFLELCASKQIQVTPLITHRFSISEAERAYELVGGRLGQPFLGVILNYPESASPTRTVDLKTSSKAVRPSSPRVTVIGAGNFAKSVLVPELARRRHVRLHTVVSNGGISARHIADKFGFSRCSTNTEESLADSQSDLVVIATRHHLHASQAAEALRQGKAVFLEKPLAIDRIGLSKVAIAARASNRPLLVDFNRRFAPLTAELKSFLSTRSQPMIIQYRINAGRVPDDSWVLDPNVGGGRIIGEACHFIDWCSSVTDSEVSSIFAQSTATSRAPFRNDDQVVITLGMADGSCASIVYSAGGDSSAPKERIEILCGGTSAVLDDFRLFEGTRGGRSTRARSLIKDKGHGGALDAFLNAVRDGSPGPIPLRSLINTTLATFAAVESQRTGQVIQLSTSMSEIVL